VKALSLWQPWATLVAVCAKRFETRGWSTAYRGPLAIHAAKKWDRDLAADAAEEPFRSALMLAGVEFTASTPTTWIHAASYRYSDGLPFGGIVALAELVDVYPTADARFEHEIDAHAAPHERAFGNYEPRRFAWKLANVRRLADPVLCRGYQALWTLDPLVVAQVEGELRRAA
jgi:hypothetical protein